MTDENKSPSTEEEKPVTTSDQDDIATLEREARAKREAELEPRQPGGCKLKTAPVRPVVAARPAEYVCSEDLFY